MAKAYVGALRELLRALEVSDVRMEQGSMRCDANVSLRPKAEGDDPAAQDAVPLGTRTETKNVNSLRSVERADPLRDHPARGDPRRRRVDPAGDPALARGHRRHDLGSAEVRRRRLPLLPRARPRAGGARPGLGGRAARHPARAARRCAAGASSRTWGFSDLEMRDVVNAGAVELIEASVAAGAAPAGARKWWTGEIARRANVEARDLRGLRGDAGARGRARRDGERRPAERLDGPPGARRRARRRGHPDAGRRRPRAWSWSATTARSPTAVDAVIAANPDVAAKVRDGKVQAAGALIGQVMKQMKGQADAAKVRALILAQLGA